MAAPCSKSSAPPTVQRGSARRSRFRFSPRSRSRSTFGWVVKLGGVEKTRREGIAERSSALMQSTRANFDMNRRSFLGFTAGGLGYLALAHLLSLEGFVSAADKIVKSSHPLAPKLPHHTP